jgi:uncharacterized protein
MVTASSVESRATETLNSALYEGLVVHQRSGPGGYGFSQRVSMVLFDLSELGELCGRHHLWSARHFAPVWFRRADYLGRPEVSLDDAVRDLVLERTGTRPSGPIRLLTHPRTYGWCFNPISCYYCFDPTGAFVEWMVAEVTSTPWRERHCYVVGPPGMHQLQKELHVSPFLPMNLHYNLDYSAPGETLGLHFDVRGPDGTSLLAGVELSRVVADRAELGRLCWRPWRGTIGVTAGIYRHAFGLARAGYQLHRHPEGPPRTGCRDA